MKRPFGRGTTLRYCTGWGSTLKRYDVFFNKEDWRVKETRSLEVKPTSAKNMSFHGTDLLTKYQGVTSLRRCWKKSFLEGKLDLPPKAWICLLFGDFYAFHPMGPPFKGEYFWGPFSSKTSNKTPNLRKIDRTPFLGYLRSIRHRRNHVFFFFGCKEPGSIRTTCRSIPK